MFFRVTLKKNDPKQRWPEKKSAYKHKGDRKKKLVRNRRLPYSITAAGSDPPSSLVDP